MRLDKGVIGALKSIRGILVRENVPLDAYTTFRIGGPARLWIAPQGIESLEAVLRILKRYRVEFHMLGGGSNVIISDSGLGCVLSTCQLTWIRSLDGTLYEVGAGTPMKRLVPYAVRNGLAGIEHLCGIPGSLGGAIVMNAGSSLGTIKDCLDSVFVVSEEGGHWLPASTIRFGYRSTEFPGIGRGSGTVVVAAARLRFGRARPETLRHTMCTMMKRRQKSQPIGEPSAGCIFKNPRGEHAGALIEASGLKGMGVGGARISRKHANFIVNFKRARAQDVIDLIKTTQDVVYREHGTILEPEVKIMGMAV